MKKSKMKLLVKRLPNDGLSELSAILSDEISERKQSGKYTKSLPDSVEKFCETTLPKGLKI